MTFRLAAYAVCSEADQVLLVQAVQPDGTTTWTLPGGRVEPLEDPFDAVVREFAEETGFDAAVMRLLGVDSRVIPATESFSGKEHQNIGIYYEVQITGGSARDETNGDTLAPTWIPTAAIPDLARSSLVDAGLRLARLRPATGHVDPVTVDGLIQH